MTKPFKVMKGMFDQALERKRGGAQVLITKEEFAEIRAAIYEFEHSGPPGPRIKHLLGRIHAATDKRYLDMMKFEDKKYIVFMVAHIEELLSKIEEITDGCEEWNEGSG